MLEEIKLIISKNLPAEVGDLLKKRLQDAEQLESNYKNLSKDFKELQTIRDGLANENHELKAKIKNAADVEMQRLKNEEDARNLKLVIAEMRLKMVEEKYCAIQTLADTVFRNPKLTYYSYVNTEQENRNGYKENYFSSKNSTITEEK